MSLHKKLQALSGFCSNLQ